MESQSGSPVRNQIISRINIHEQALGALKETVGKVLSDYGEDPIPTAFVPSQWSQRDLQKAFGEVSYPYIAIIPGEVRKIYGESYNPMLAMHYSKNIRIDDEQVMRLMLMPIEANFRLQLVSQDQSTCQKVLESYLFRYKSMRFILKAQKLEIAIKLRVGDSVSFPEQTMEEGGNVFRMDFDLSMLSYIGECQTIRSIKQNTVSIVTQGASN